MLTMPIQLNFRLGLLAWTASGKTGSEVLRIVIVSVTLLVCGDLFVLVCKPLVTST